MSAPEGWPKFEVVCVELKSKEYAFTTDAENDEKAKSAVTVQYYKDANSNYVSAHRLRETPKMINAHPESNNIDMVKSNRGRTTTVISTLGLEEINLSECDMTKLTYLSLKKLMAEFMLFREDMIEWRQTMECRANVKSKNEITPSKFLEEHGLTKLITKLAFDCIVESGMKKTVKSILKKIFEREPAMKCTAVRNSNKTGSQKLVLKGYQFYDDVFEFVRAIHSGNEPVIETLFYQGLSSSLSDAKDWDRHRKYRQAK
ncbi:hypothetical protein PV328_012095, partial [Microctonus aethiopoides]